MLEFASFLQVMMFMLKYNIGKRVKYINKYILDVFFIEVKSHFFAKGTLCFVFCSSFCK